jgi:hypothetical protein
VLFRFALAWYVGAGQRGALKGPADQIRLDAPPLAPQCADTDGHSPRIAGVAGTPHCRRNSDDVDDLNRCLEYTRCLNRAIARSMSIRIEMS